MEGFTPEKEVSGKTRETESIRKEKKTLHEA